MNTDNKKTKSASNPWRTFGIIVITVAVTLGVSYWVFNAYLFPSAFTPVRLSAQGRQRLDRKLERLGVTPAGRQPPKPYSEAGAGREITLSQRELNALVARDTDFGNRLAINLSANLASAELLIPLDPALPLVGGRTLRVTAGLELAINDGHPRAVLKGVSVWGIPLPNAWLGNLKNVNLLQQFDHASGFWQAISQGVDEFRIKDGALVIRLKH